MQTTDVETPATPDPELNETVLAQAEGAEAPVEVTTSIDWNAHIVEMLEAGPDAINAMVNGEKPVLGLSVEFMRELLDGIKAEYKSDEQIASAWPAFATGFLAGVVTADNVERRISETPDMLKSLALHYTVGYLSSIFGDEEEGTPDSDIVDVESSDVEGVGDESADA